MSVVHGNGVASVPAVQSLEWLSSVVGRRGIGGGVGGVECCGGSRIDGATLVNVVPSLVTNVGVSSSWQCWRDDRLMKVLFRLLVVGCVVFMDTK